MLRVTVSAKRMTSPLTWRAARPGGLDERGLAAKIAFLVGVEDADEADFRQVEAFAEQVDADEDIELGGAQGAQDFDALDGVDVAVEIADFQADVAQVIGEIFGRAFGEGGDEDALVQFDALAAELDGFVDLFFERADGDPRVEQAGGADDLLDDEARIRGGDVEILPAARSSGKPSGGRSERFPPRRCGRACAGSSPGCLRRCFLSQTRLAWR